MRNTKHILALVLFGVLLTSCLSNNKTESKNGRKKSDSSVAIKAEEHWSYEGETGPEHWADIVKNSSCGGEFQSPINILSDDAVLNEKLLPLDIQYASSTKIHDVHNNGHSIQYNFAEGDYINFNGARYDLKQIHFHESSEHTIDGIRYPMVIHMVHVNSEGKYAVLAVMVKEGKASAPFNFLENYLPVQKGETKIIDKPFNLNLNIPQNKGYFTYTGSLTTPPCTEGVNWVIFKEPITLAEQQVKQLRNLMPIDNYRNEQPLNGRVVSVVN